MYKIKGETVAEDLQILGFDILSMSMNKYLCHFQSSRNNLLKISIINKYFQKNFC